MAEFRHISGMAELAKTLGGLAANVQRNALRKAVSSGAAIIRNEARAIAPVDTGEMRRDVQMKRERTADSQIATYAVYVRSGKKSRLAGKARGVERDSFYWRFVEFGTSKMAARPFMRPAFEAKKNEAAEMIRDTLRQRIAEITK